MFFRGRDKDLRTFHDSGVSIQVIVRLLGFFKLAEGSFRIFLGRVPKNEISKGFGYLMCLGIGPYTIPMMEIFHPFIFGE